MGDLVEVRKRPVRPAEQNCANCVHSDPSQNAPGKHTCWIDGMIMKASEWCPKWKEYK